MVIAFLVTSLWWIGCTLPLAKRYRQSAYVEAGSNPLGETFRQLGRTLRDARKEKHIFLYLLSFFFFIDGVYTIIEMATAYGTSLGLDTTGLLLALLWTQIVAFPCAIIFGRLAAKHDTGKLIKLCILCYTGITLFAVFLLTQWQFWLLATLVGMFQGGIQALSRSYLGKIVPAEHSGEYYGLMDICGKGASFLGLFLVGVVSNLTDGLTYRIFGLELQSQSLAVASLVVIFIIGYVLFCKADKLNRK
jgi:UMF1 family MFS transporter